MNKNFIFGVFGLLAALGIIIAGVLIALGIDPSLYMGMVINILGIVSVAAGTFYSLGKQNSKLNTIESNTNGRLTARDNEIKRLTNILIAQGINPSDISTGAIEIIASPVYNANEDGGKHVAS